MAEAPIKVIRVIARLNVGGPAIHTTGLSEALGAHGFETLLITGTPGRGEASYEELFGTRPKGYRLVKLAGLRRMPSGIGDLAALFQLIWIFLRERPSIVHTHTAKAGTLGRLAAFVTGVPIVVHTFHGHVLSGYFPGWVSRAITWVERTLARRTTAIVALSPALKEELTERFAVAPPSKLHVIVEGRDLGEFEDAGRFKAALKEELGISSPDAKLILTVGRLVPIKNQDLLLRSFARMRATHPAADAYLAIAGQGELAPALRALARELGIEDRVRFLGWRSDLPKLYGGSDVFVLSSDNEGMPISIIESFAAGCPVVSTAVGGVPDMFHPGAHPGAPAAPGVTPMAEGILVEKGSEEALAAALGALITNEELRAACSAAARAASRAYSEERLAQDVAALYRDLLARNGR